jgi:sirohydrochlorin cobaltochelatase
MLHPDERLGHGNEEDRRAPMAPAPMKFNDDGSVAWGEMWDSFCILAIDGGPRHRETMLHGDPASDLGSEGYQTAVTEIARGVTLVSGLTASAGDPGWVTVRCHSAGMARWLAEAIIEENVDARAVGDSLLVPVAEHFALKGEIKNVITAVAKTSHYWREHLPAEVKQTLELQARLGGVKEWFVGWLRRRPAASVVPPP